MWYSGRMKKREMTVQEFASRGGKARAAKMTAAERKASATKAVTARWAKEKPERRAG